MKLEKAANEYIRWKSIRSPRAALIYKPYILRFCQYRKCDTRSITNQDVVNYIDLQSEKYNLPTIAYSCRVLKNFFRYLNSINESNVNSFLIQEPKYVKKQRIGITDIEFNLMLKTLNPLKADDLQKITILYLLYDTGMRVGELCDLNINQISSTENFTSIETKKNKQTRWIMWSEKFHKEIFLQWLGVRICLNQREALFISLDKPGRNRVCPRTIQRWVKAIAKEAGINKNIHPHMFRHSKAHRMRAVGADLKDIQMMLGHVSPFSALMYLNFDKNEMLDTAKKYL